VGWQIAQFAAFIQWFGFTNPVLMNGADGIVAGLVVSRDPVSLVSRRRPCSSLL